MYNIAKVAKGEILVYFNQVFDALCKVVGAHMIYANWLTHGVKLAADSELSVKNGAELLDRLIKDIVAESAASYVSILQAPSETEEEGTDDQERPSEDLPTAFSLQRFLPLLEERINVLNPFTRNFLVAWISLLDSIPDLELVTHLPRFLRGLFKFLSDPNQDVKTATQKTLDRFLNEIKTIAGVKRGVAESRKSQGEDGTKQSTSSLRSGADEDSDVDSVSPGRRELIDEKEDDESAVTGSTVADDEEKSVVAEEDWVPGQDIQVDHGKILDILVTFLGDPRGRLCRKTKCHFLTQSRGGKGDPKGYPSHGAEMDRQFLRDLP